MIYEIVNNCLGSLANQWRDLGAAFQQLASHLPAGDPLIPLIGNPAVPRGAPAGWQQQCDNDPNADYYVPRSPIGERQRIEQWQLVHQNLRPALDLFRQATQVFEASNLVCIDLRNQFVGAFGRPSDADTVDVATCRNLLDGLQRFIANCLQDFEEITSAEGERFSLSGIRSSAENIASYPVWASAPNAAPISVPSIPGAGTAPLQKTIESALKGVLGRVPKPNDTRSFAIALKQSFQLQEVEGHVEFKWTPQSFAGQTDLGGGVTGAQASLATRAQVALDKALPLLDGLYPLQAGADSQEAEAARAIVRTELTELVKELGVEGGPRIARVDELFDQLLRYPTTGLDQAIIPNGKLNYLRTVYGLNQGQVNTLDEETNVTNFTALYDYVTSIQASWANFRDNLFGRDLGTRLILLSRALSVVAESVDEVYAAMDSVFVGSAERQVAAFRMGDGRLILVQELLSWVTDYATFEAPKLIQEGGRRGVEAIVSTAQRLGGLVRRLIQSIPNEATLPDGLRHPRVRHPLEELRGYLFQVQQLAQDVRAPAV